MLWQRVWANVNEDRRMDDEVGTRVVRVCSECDSIWYWTKRQYPVATRAKQCRRNGSHLGKLRWFVCKLYVVDQSELTVEFVPSASPKQPKTTIAVPLTHSSQYLFIMLWTLAWISYGYSWVCLIGFHKSVIFCLCLRSIYKEIGAGERIALSKLAIEKFEQTGRPLRIAIDISIWLFQIQSSKGMNSEKYFVL